jgi:hypothetical protein
MRFVLFFSVLLLSAFPLWPQGDDPLLLVGIKLEKLIERFGAPKAVHAARGSEVWQDDVVFSYDEGNFYLYKDRVWQVALKSAYGIAIGDAKQLVFLVLGEAAEDKGGYILMPLQSEGWPLMLRLNVNSAAKVSAIFIYRSDF